MGDVSGRRSSTTPHSLFFFANAAYSRLVDIDEQIERLVGVSAGLLLRYPGSVMALIHPGDRVRFRSALESAAAGNQLDETVRLAQDPEWRRISVRATRSPSDTQCVAGIIWDSSDRYDELVDLARRRDREVLLAARIQRSLLCDTTPVSDHGFSIAGTTIPSQWVDGDFYALLSCYDGSYDVALGDVMGKGVGAALLAAGTRLGLLRAMVSLLRFGPGERVPPSPGAIVQNAHGQVFDDLYRLNRFVTLAYARFDSTRARLSFVDFGNPPAVLYRPTTDEVWYLKGHNCPLGFLKDEQPVILDVPIERNDLVLYFSDGLSDAVDADGEPFGVDRIAQFLSNHAHLSEHELLNNLVSTVREFTHSESLGDDASIIAVRHTSERVARLVKRRIMRMQVDIDGLRKLPGFLRLGMRDIAHERLSERAAISMVLAVREVASRIITYCISDLDGGITVFQSCYPDWISVQLTYEGEPYDPQSHRADNLDAEMAARILESSRCSVCYCAGPEARSSVIISLRL